MLNKLTLTALTTLIRQALMELQFNVPTLGDTQSVYATYITANHPGESSLMPTRFDGIPKGKLTDKIEEIYANKMQATQQSWAPANAPVPQSPEPVNETSPEPQNSQGPETEESDEPQQSPEVEQPATESDAPVAETLPSDEVEDAETENADAAPQAPVYHGFLYSDSGDLIVDDAAIGSGEYTFKLFVEAVDASAEGDADPVLNELNQDQIDSLIAAGLDFTASIDNEDGVVEILRSDADATAQIELEVGEEVETVLTVRVTIKDSEQNEEELLSESFAVQA